MNKCWTLYTMFTQVQQNFQVIYTCLKKSLILDCVCFTFKKDVEVVEFSYEATIKSLLFFIVLIIYNVFGGILNLLVMSFFGESPFCTLWITS